METQAGLDEPRIVNESGVAGRIAALAGPVAQGLGFRLVRVRMNGPVLQIMAEREDGSFSIDDCETLSRALSPALDAEDVIKSHYQLEVSSPGIDRFLVRASDFPRWLGYEVKIELESMIGNRKRLRGFIEAADAREALVAVDGEDAPLRVPYSAIDEAKLVMNDRLLAEAKRRACSGDVLDGALFDAAKRQDITMKEDRRNSHGR